MRILVADDSDMTRILLADTLQQWGYDVVVASDGMEAWEKLTAQDAPQLAILDWMMPGIPGPEICRRLRARKSESLIYVILLTARTDQQDINQGLQSGADDFMTKPFDTGELQSRLGVGMRLLAYDAQLQEQNAKLKEYAAEMEALAEQRARQLIHADRLVTLGTMAATVVHEIKNPLFAITLTLSLLEDAIKEMIQRASAGDANAETLSGCATVIKDHLSKCEEGVRRVDRIVRSLGSFSKRQTSLRVLAPVNPCIERAVDVCNGLLKRVKPIIELRAGLPLVNICTQEIEQVLVNLIANACQAMDGRKEKVVRIASQEHENGVNITVEDSGPGVSAENYDKVFDAFFTTKAEKGTGLGLAISRSIVDSHGGAISFENRAEGGARFIVSLPAPDSAEFGGANRE
jgi:two-component system NtrC family sensor kinase